MNFFWGVVTTAVYSTCGISVFVFLAAAVLSMPKQFMLILVGVLAENSGECDFSDCWRCPW